jgi:hypothetical protein
MAGLLCVIFPPRAGLLAAAPDEDSAREATLAADGRQPRRRWATQTGDENPLASIATKCIVKRRRATAEHRQVAAEMTMVDRRPAVPGRPSVARTAGAVCTPAVCGQPADRIQATKTEREL